MKTSIVVCARAWEDQNGNIYHSEYMFLNGERVGYHRGGGYSDSQSIEETAINWLIKNQKIPARLILNPGEACQRYEHNYDYCLRTNTQIESVTMWVSYKKDL